MTRRIAIFGGSFSPPGEHHRAIAQRLAEHFDEIVVVPCGPRPDKPITNDVAPIYRATMVDLAFRDLPRVRVELFDLEAATFTRTHALEDRFRSAGEVWHVVGADWLANAGTGLSLIQRKWEQGQRLWDKSRFAIIARQGVDLHSLDLPPHHKVFPIDQAGRSMDIRSRIFQRQPIEGLVSPSVASYIERHGLYRGVAPSRHSTFHVPQPRIMVVADERNPEATRLASGLGNSSERDPELIVVIGGDGTMLRAIRQHWRRRVPFYGINAGHLGFLLNDDPTLDFVHAELVLHQLPLLWVETESTQGERRAALAFNDCWVERSTGQTAWIKVLVNGQERLPQLVADGVLVSTAAGSASYARAMGATPLPLNTPALLLVGSNVLRPPFWRPVVLPLGSVVDLHTLDPVKRPLHGYVDGVSHGLVSTMRARLSNIAAVELVFAPAHDPAAKLAQIQFPAPG